jgi:HTH-type transcriptional regulator/antitoxin HigA
MMTDTQIYSDLAIPPGEYLEEVIEDLGMSKAELAKRMNRPPAKLSAIFNGNKAITPDTALQLENVVGVPAHIWTNLESNYRLTLARNAERADEARLKGEAHLVTKFCYKELIAQKLVQDTTVKIERVRELHRYMQ